MKGSAHEVAEVVGTSIQSEERADGDAMVAKMAGSVKVSPCMRRRVTKARGKCGGTHQRSGGSGGRVLAKHAKWGQYK